MLELWQKYMPVLLISDIVVTSNFTKTVLLEKLIDHNVWACPEEVLLQA
jgi:hypothetical protein